MAVPSTISLIDSLKNRTVILLSDTTNIIVLFETLHYSNVKIIQYTNVRRWRLWSPRRELMNKMKPYKVNDLYFFHFDYGGLANWYLKVVGKKANVNFCKLFDRKPYKKIPFWKCAYPKLNEFVRFGVWMDFHDNMIPSTPDSFYNYINAKTIIIPISDSAIQLALNHLGLGNSDKRILLLTGSVVAGGYVNRDDYEEYINLVIDAVGKENIMMKCHPRFEDLFGEEQQLPSIPNYIPGNLFLYNFDLVIGYNSLMLAEAARKGVKTISLIEIIPPSNDQLRVFSRNYIQERLEGKGVVLYPTSIEELKLQII